ncbi:MAG: YigZ family protein [Bacteroidetes bacterium]|jgi:uncharacterized YigZ family protein|nr:YigZ family protein [Bacteroidota bacterium]
MKFEYSTIKLPVEDILLREKGSKFIGFAYPLQQEGDAKKYLTQLWELHPKATHICYAYRVGLQGEIHRANDDGEPSGSAGLPIYNQLLAHEVTNVLVAVVRYYGGTKLGVSGLVKTYKESAKMTLESAEIITKELEGKLKIIFDYHQQNTIFTFLNKNEAQILEFNTEEKCSIVTSFKMIKKESISEKLSEMQNIEFQFLD